MSRRGNPYDNAHVESFFKTLKHEEIESPRVYRRLIGLSVRGSTGAF